VPGDKIRSVVSGVALAKSPIQPEILGTADLLRESEAYYFSRSEEGRPDEDLRLALSPTSVVSQQCGNPKFYSGFYLRPHFHAAS
jgi:hypothetical protein